MVRKRSRHIVIDLVVGPFALQGAQISFGGLALPQQRQRVAEALIMRGVNAVAFVAGYLDHRHELIVAFHLLTRPISRADVVCRLQPRRKFVG